MRLWNYNKSRIHSFRGARFVELRLDQHLIFRGEINKAPGNVPDAHASAEPILFTMDARILDRIDAGDAAGVEEAVRGHLSGTLSAVARIMERHPDYF